MQHKAPRLDCKEAFYLVFGANDQKVIKKPSLLGGLG